MKGFVHFYGVMSCCKGTLRVVILAQLDEIRLEKAVLKELTLAIHSCITIQIKRVFNVHHSSRAFI